MIIHGRIAKSKKRILSAVVNTCTMDQNIFKNNRVIFDKLKEDHGDIYADLMEVFKKAKTEKA